MGFANHLLERADRQRSFGGDLACDSQHGVHQLLWRRDAVDDTVLERLSRRKLASGGEKFDGASLSSATTQELGAAETRHYTQPDLGQTEAGGFGRIGKVAGKGHL